jgi:uracil-DNA glycosylase
MIYTIAMAQADDLDSFRSAARKLLAGHIDPADVAWTDGDAATLFPNTPPDRERIAFVPRAFVSLAEVVACHRDTARWSLLYQLLWRLAGGEQTLMQRVSDPLVHRLQHMAAAVRRDQHRMTAFVRFRVITDEHGAHSVAWYEPRHRSLRGASTFFIDRFANLRFSILTPDLTLHWDRQAATFGPGVSRRCMPSPDAMEDWWTRYYRATFNPARSNPRLMQSHMPKFFWRYLPEARSITKLLREAGPRTDRMIQSPPAPR